MSHNCVESRILLLPCCNKNYNAATLRSCDKNGDTVTDLSILFVFLGVPGEEDDAQPLPRPARLNRAQGVKYP